MTQKKVVASLNYVNKRWPNGEIPYTLSSQYGSYSRSVIAKAMQEYHDKTCVRFVPRDARRHVDYIFIHPDDGCYSLVGKTGGRQPLSLDSGCIQVGTIVHELMHAVGFFHEQSRYATEMITLKSYGAMCKTELTISLKSELLLFFILQNISNTHFGYNLNVIDHLNEPYDYSSIMHYGPYAFSGSGKKTIVPRKNGAERMGQRIAFSEGDLRKINKLYQCSSNINGNSILEKNQSNVKLCEVHTFGDISDKFIKAMNI
ncbi:astacin [Ancylostoma duodenale]|uniref:Metalloendopeptidase n=1 Tax=Ancylostoma duodenale TaxID=51022 RepID=A0A0C2GPS9_9BILA|nr:astacin [Ancylostoma duodenale]